MKTSQARTAPSTPTRARETTPPASPSSTDKSTSTRKATTSRTVTATRPEAITRRPTETSAAEARARSAQDPTTHQVRAQLEQRVDAPAAGPATPAPDAATSTPKARRPFSVDGPAAPPAVTADEAPGLTQTTVGGTTVVSGTGDADNIQVSARKGGGVTLRNGADTIELTAAQARDLEIRGLGGDDRIYVDPSITYDITIDGGSGDDTLTGGGGDDTIEGGAGDDTIRGAGGDDVIRGGTGNDVLSGGDGGDYINGQDGDDSILGGNGRDVLYGLDGNDAITGGDGRDYIDGGAGNDRLGGGAGIDQVFGGRGDDDLRGGDGDDVLAGGEGTDAYNGDGGADRIYHQDGEWIANDGADTRTQVDMSGPEPGSSITVTGTADFQDRVASDLDAMRSIPSGRSMLEGLDASGQAVTLQQTDGGNSASYFTSARMTSSNTVNGTPSDATINYNPEVIDIGSRPWNERPPIVGLFHEMVHAENAMTGTVPTGTDVGSGDPNVERIAVGLDIDHDGDPSTPRIQPNANNENRFRGELNLENRDDY